MGSLSNAAGAVLVFVLLAVLDAGDDVPVDRRVELLALFISLLAVATAVAGGLLTRRARPLLDALDGGQPLTGRARAALFEMPWANAALSSAMWFVAAAVFGTHAATRLGATAGEAAGVGAIIALGGLTTGGVVYLLLERGLRPVFARAFAHEGPDQRIPGVAVGPRLVLVWMLGSGVPLLIAALVALDPDDGAQVQAQLLPWVLAGFVIGLAVTAAAARSLAEPLAGLRQAMRSVQQADFGVRSPVDDATEVGLLQAGFNEMVEGLGEREQLRDLFGRHVGVGVAQQALERGAELGGEQVEASALFVDLVGSTALAATRPPGEVVALLNELFEAVVEAVERHGGWVNKFEGDAALCVFGPPAGHIDHGVRALEAARDLRTAIDDLRTRHPDIDAGIGVSSGRVVAGNVGSERRYEYTVIGDPVNEAARITELAKLRPGRLLASGSAVVAAGGAEAEHWRQVGADQLRGRPDTTQLWEPGAAASAPPQ